MPLQPDHLYSASPAVATIRFMRTCEHEQYRQLATGTEGVTMGLHHERLRIVSIYFRSDAPLIIPFRIADGEGMPNIPSGFGGGPH